jgi:hypothetical protein
MDFLKIARCCFIGAVVLLAASCAETTPPPSGSDDNGANCGGTVINKESCINNQNRMP